MNQLKKIEYVVENVLQKDNYMNQSYMIVKLNNQHIVLIQILVLKLVKKVEYYALKNVILEWN